MLRHAAHVGDSQLATRVAQWLLNDQNCSGKCSCGQWWKAWSVLTWGMGLLVLSSLIISLHGLFMWSRLRWARRFMIGLCPSSHSAHSERIRRPVSRTMSTWACRLCCIWTRKKLKTTQACLYTLVRRYRFDLDTPPDQDNLSARNQS